MISLQHVSKTYGGKQKAVTDLNWNIEDGRITGFIGPNGAGKTTTLKMITGILAPDEGGVITVNGCDISREPLAAKRQFGFVSDSPDNFLRLKGVEYLNFMGDIYGVPSDLRKSRITDFAERFEMANALTDRIQSYSHGMRQKIMVMGALLHDPAVWILDEPLTGLDPKAAFSLKEMMREHAAAGKLVLFSTHVLEVAEKLCDRIAIISSGRIVFLGTLAALRDQYGEEESLEEIFLKVTQNA